MRPSLLPLCAVLACAHARAETVEQVVNPRRASKTWVSDMARVLDSDTKRQLNALSNRLERADGTEVAVVTVQRADGLEPKPFATKLFNLWGIGKRGRDNGVLLLLVMEARRVEVETGNGMGRILPDARVQSILNQSAVPRFRQGDYAGGVLACVEDMARLIEDSGTSSTWSGTSPGATTRRTAKPKSRRTPRPAASRATPARSSRQVPESSIGTRPNPQSDFGWLPIVGGALLLPLGGALAWRSRTRHCPRCKQKMQRLSETEDDALLSFDQQFEENLGSVDYRAWRCLSCGATTVERAVRWLSGYEDCPKCIHRSVSSQTTIVRHPTYTSTGQSLVTRTCHFPGCGFGDQKKRTLPRKQRPSSHSGSSHHSSGSSSSGSSGSFGGGSSSGGGAGASW